MTSESRSCASSAFRPDTNPACVTGDGWLSTLTLRYRTVAVASVIEPDFSGFRPSLALVNAWFNSTDATMYKLSEYVAYETAARQGRLSLHYLKYLLNYYPMGEGERISFTIHTARKDKHADYRSVSHR